MKKNDLKKATNPPGQIVDMSIQFISIVPAGANGQVGIAKALEGGEPLTIAVAEIKKGSQTVKTPVLADLTKAVIRKEDVAKQLLYCPVYCPGVMDIHGNWAEAEVIEKAAHEFLATFSQGNVDLSHSYVPEDCVVVESWVTKGVDPLFPNVPEGTWCVCLKVNNPDIWAGIEKGEFKSVSMGGTAKIIPPEESIEKGASGMSDSTDNKEQGGWLAKVRKILPGGKADALEKEETGPVSFGDYTKDMEAWGNLWDLLYDFRSWALSLFDGAGTKEEKIAAFNAGTDELKSKAAPLFMNAVEKSDEGDEAKAAAIAKAREIVDDVLKKEIAVVKAEDDEALKAAMADLEKTGDAEVKAVIEEIAKSVTDLNDKVEALEKGGTTPGDPDNPPPEPATVEKTDEIKSAVEDVAATLASISKKVDAIGQTVAPSKVQKETEPAKPEGGEEEGWGVLPKKK